MRVQIHPPTRISLSRKAARSSAFALAILLGLSGAHAASLPHPHHQPKDIVHTITDLERQWEQAQLAGNVGTIDSMLADDYLGIYSDGTLATKAETLESVKDGSVHFSEIRTSDRKIRVFGRSTVVVVSKAQVTGTHDGESLDGMYRYTRVYHRHNGVWQIVSFEASSIQPHSKHHPAAEEPPPTAKTNSPTEP